jgi:hypothetical protein
MFNSIRRAVAVTGTALTLGLGGALCATSAASAAPATVPACSTGSLAVWVNVSAGTVAAGTTAWPLDFTNTGRRSCTLRGYPGASATNLSGRQLGRAADREPNPRPTTVTIPAGGTAHSYLFWVQVANFPSGCKQTTASLLKVYPHGQRSAVRAFFSQPVCTSTKPLYQYLFVTTVQPGVGHAL